MQKGDLFFVFVFCLFVCFNGWESIPRTEIRGQKVPVFKQCFFFPCFLFCFVCLFVCFLFLFCFVLFFVLFCFVLYFLRFSLQNKSCLGVTLDKIIFMGQICQETTLNSCLGGCSICFCLLFLFVLFCFLLKMTIPY